MNIKRLNELKKKKKRGRGYGSCGIESGDRRLEGHIRIK